MTKSRHSARMSTMRLRAMGAGETGRPEISTLRDECHNRGLQLTQRRGHAVTSVALVLIAIPIWLGLIAYLCAASGAQAQRR
jgi:hypothetical protein